MLSADPVLAAAQAVLLPTSDQDQALLGAYDGGPSTHPALLPAPDPGTLDFVPDPLPRLSAAQSLASTFAVDATVFDVASLASRSGYVDGVLTVAANETLKGSGTLQVGVINEGLISPGYSPGVDNLPSITQLASSTMLIELGGANPGTGDGFHDQINVSGLASLDGTLEVALLGGFRPTDGQEFEFLTFGTVSGAFANGAGLIQAANDLYFEVRATPTSLKLVAHQLDSTTDFVLDLLQQGAGAAANDLLNKAGTWLNFDYFHNNQSFSYTGSLDLGQGVKLTGGLEVGYSADVSLRDPLGVTRAFDVWKIGALNGNGYLGLDRADPNKPGVEFSQVSFGVVLLDASDPGVDMGFTLAQGSAGGLSFKGLQGANGFGISASSMTLDVSKGLGQLNGAANDAGIDLSGQAQTVSVGGTTFTFNGNGDLGNHADLSGSATVTAGPISFQGALGFSKSDQGLVLTGDSVTVSLNAGGLRAGVDNASFGLLVLPDNTYAIEASGAAFVDGGGFASVSATSALLRFNNTGTDLSGQALTAGAVSHTFGSLASVATPALSVTGLSARVADTFLLSGDYAFERDATTHGMELLATNAAVSVLAGGFSAGVSGAQVAIVLDATTGSVDLLEASGQVAVQLGDAVSVAASSAQVRWNASGADASGQAIDVAGKAYSFGANFSAGLQQVSVTGATVTVGDFFRASGSFDFLRSSATLKLASDVAGTRKTTPRTACWWTCSLWVPAASARVRASPAALNWPSPVWNSRWRWPAAAATPAAAGPACRRLRAACPSPAPTTWACRAAACSCT